MARFSFEDLEVWRKAVEFAQGVIELAESVETDRKHFRLIEQLEASSTSIAANIAEGKGRYSKKEFVQFLYIARGSLFETITLLIILNRNNWISDSQLDEAKTSGEEIGKMLSGMITSIRNTRDHEL
jgi:four helix bundle protein